MVRNAGNVATPDGVVLGMSFEIGGKTVAVVGTSHTAALLPGETATLSSSDAGGQGWTAVTGDQTVTAFADNENLIAESNEDDNKRDKTFVVGKPNLVIDSVSVSPATPIPGSAVTFGAVVRNAGDRATPAGAVLGLAFQIGGQTVASVGASHTASLLPGETATLSSSDAGGQGWTAVAGDQTVTAIADNGNLIAESNEDDNTRAKSFVVGQPNLVIDSLSVSPSNPQPGESVTFSAVVRNAGNVATPAGTIHGMNFQIAGATAAYIGNSHTASLAPGQTATFSSSDAGGRNWTAVAGNQTVTAFVDNGNLIAESNENDNTLSKSFVVGKPNLVIDSITVVPATPTSGSAVVFRAVVRNAGTAPTPAGTIHGMNFQIGGRTVAYVGNSHTASLAPGQTATFSSTDAGGRNWTAVAGNQTVTAFVDNGNLIAESNESDNTLSKTFSVTAARTAPSGSHS